MKNKISIAALLCLALIGILLLVQNNESNNGKVSHLVDKSDEQDSSEASTNAVEEGDKSINLPDSFKDIIYHKESIEKDDRFIGLTQAEQHQLSEWDMRNGSSLEQKDLYINYDKKTIYALAKQGDIYAMQAAASQLIIDLNIPEALDTLRDAAALGSIEALYMLGARYGDAIYSLKKGHETEEQIRDKFNVPVFKDYSLEKSLEILAAAHYMASALRGDAYGAVVHIDAFENYPLQREIAKEDWPAIIKNANAIYTAIDERREKMNADELDNSYPAPYARLHGLPKENNMSEKFCEILEGDC